MAEGGGGKGGASEEWRNWLDVVAKLLGAVAVVWLGWVGHLYQSSLSATSLLNQREQAESQLRAAMLHDLIEPVIGHPQALKDIDPERERLLVELLTLNFHDHFEFKPLLEEAFKRQRGKEGRDRLESVARRVIDRQINMLMAISETMGGSFKSEAKTYAFAESAWRETPNPSPPASSGRCLVEARSDAPGDFDGLTTKPICASSPDKNLCLEIVLYKPDYKYKSVLADMKVYATGSAGCDKLRTEESRDKPIVFLPGVQVSVFDFPLSDNTEIDPRHRFAVSLYYMGGAGDAMQFKLVWFPEGYVADRERPVNYTDVRRLLGVQKEAERKAIW